MENNKNYRIVHAQKSDIGIRRSENQDSVGKFPEETNDLSYPKGQLFVVADGMGGHDYGKEASETAVRIIGEKYHNDPSPDILKRLRSAIRSANDEILKIANTHRKLTRMGTTCSTLVLTDGYAYIGHVGDSRIYHVNRSGITQLTDDHTQVAEMHRRGILTTKEVKEHPAKSVLMRALGVNHDIDIDLIERIPIKPGDIFLMCTDGLAKVHKEELKNIVLSHPPESACNILIDYANQQGGDDNITVQIIHYEEADNNQIPDSAQKQTGKYFGRTIGFLFALFILVYTFVQYNPFVGSEGKNNSGESLLLPEQHIQLLLQDAQRYYENGQLDSALAIYRGILFINPLHVGSLEGIDQIAGDYKLFVDKHTELKQYDEAIIYLHKVIELQPLNKNLLEELDELKQLAVGTPQIIRDIDEREVPVEKMKDEVTPGDADLSGEMPDEINKREYIIRSDKWIFPGLSDREYSIDSVGIRFHKSPVTKKAIYTDRLGDIDIEVQAQITASPPSGTFGIMLGYDDQTADSAAYFLFTIDNSFTCTLRKVSADYATTLFSIPIRADAESRRGLYRLKVKSLGPWLMIYKDNKVLQAWLNDEIIEGAFGLYADPDIDVMFYSLRLQSALHSLN